MIFVYSHPFCFLPALNCQKEKSPPLILSAAGIFYLYA